MKPNNKLNFLSGALIALAALHGPTSRAQTTNNNTNSTTRLPDVVVEGQQENRLIPQATTSATKTDTPLLETPQSVSLLTDWEMQAQGVDTLAEAFRYTPGVQSEVFGFESRFTWIRIRGIDATTSGLYRDGLQLRNPGFLVSYNLEPFGAELIEIPKGPASVLYGASTAGGLVNFVTKRPQTDTFYQVSGMAGNFDHYEGRIDLNTPLGEEKKFAFRLTGLLRDADTQQDFVEDDSAYLAPALTWRPREGTSMTLLTHYQNHRTKASSALPLAGTMTSNPNGTLPVSRYIGEPGLDYYDRDEFSIGLFTEHQANEWLTLSQSSRFHRTELDSFLVYAQSLDADQRTLQRSVFASDGAIDGVTLDNRAQFDFMTGSVDHTLLAGLDYQHVDVDAMQSFAFNGGAQLDLFNPVYGAPLATQPTVFSDARTRQDQVGFYLQDQFNYDDRLFVTLGGRYDIAKDEATDRTAGTDREQDNEEFTGRVGVLYKTDWDISPYASYSESFLPVAGVDSAGTPFEPELGRQWEIGVKYQPENLSGHLTFSYFDLTRENFTEFDSATFAQVQTGEITARGVELDGRLSLGYGIDLLANFTYLDAEISESVNASSIGERPQWTPEYIASTWLNYSFPRGFADGLSLRAGTRFIDSTYGNLPNTLESEEAVLFDFGLAYVWKKLSINLTIQNAFDKEYVASTFQRGGTGFGTFGQTRDIVGSLTYTF